MNERRSNKSTPAENTAVTANVASNLGKLPPQALDLEEAVLGTILQISKTYEKVMEYFIPEIFYKECHQKICSSVIRLYKSGKAIDILTVANELRNNGELEEVGGDTYIVSLTMRIGSNANIETHLLILWEKFIMRENIRLSSESIRDSFDDFIDPFENVYKYKKALEELEGRALKGSKSKFKDIAKEVIDEIITLADDGKITGLPSYIYSADAITHGGRKGELTITAARPSMGKSALIIQEMINQSIKKGHKIAFFSLEMSKSEVIKRIFANMTMVNSAKFNSGKLTPFDKENMVTTLKQIENSFLFIEDTAFTLQEIIARATKMKMEQGIEKIYIDYLQLIELTKDEKKGSREQEISHISRSVKLLAKKLDIPIDALSQLSRKVEERNPQIPQLSDLRESGAIEQDADVVRFLYRPEYYKKDKDIPDEDIDGKCYVIYAKNRNGKLDKITLQYLPQFNIFQDEHFPVTQEVPYESTPISPNAAAMIAPKPRQEDDTKIPF